jgi:hypothetical protein
MTVAELKAELQRIKENLCDIEDMHAFTYGKTSIHIGGAKAHQTQLEFEEECRTLNEQIVGIEKELKTRGTS